MTSTIPTNVLEYEPFDAANRADQFGWYSRLREEAPVLRPRSGYWVVTRYADVRHVLMSHDVFSSAPNQDEVFALPSAEQAAADPDLMARVAAIVEGMPVPMEELLAARVIVAADGEQHARIRRLTSRSFNPKRMNNAKQRIASIVDDCLRDFGSADTFELVERLATPLPVTIIGDILCVDEGDHHLIKRWADMSIEAAVSVNRGTPEAVTGLLVMLREFADYFVPRIEARRAEPRGDFVSDIVQATADDRLSVTEAMMFMNAVLQAGQESTASLIWNVVINLLRHPEQLDLLAREPDRIPAAVEETLRFTSPTQFFFRKPLRDVELSGVRIPAGEVICPMVGAANRDSREFERADEFDITRKAPHTLPFGIGAHFCIGAQLARLEATISLEKLLPELPNYRLGHVERIPNMLSYGHGTIELIRAT